MIEHAIIISCDDDIALGSYFQECANFARIIFQTQEQISLTEIKGSNCHRVYVDLKMPEECMILTIFSHGTARAFVCENQPFIDEDTKHINNKVVYTNACLVGQDFGNTLSTLNGVFIGYKAETEVFLTAEPIDKRQFIECDTYAIIYLFERRISLRELESKMVDKFNIAIKKLKAKHTADTNVMASMLTVARDNFVVLGNLDISLVEQVNH
ncbi:hypothetical protein [Beggiatoa leptomitoformis]|uniref:Uncharacterized protein n=1 Tax=Beggiatoa leptomitoformis TaxID=288004 RepID=A0A2N9YEN4_9GAMM|nr:hypothetical protein [Beggiatoa leptomitoformis]ALG68721.1 hypothetical protein AL038_14685 [Beggiatoa leptomitoformis]AUI68924.1 hypothetical protein BLE401_09570 [Beggiatoa leptomitoformis]